MGVCRRSKGKLRRFTRNARLHKIFSNAKSGAIFPGSSLGKVLSNVESGVGIIAVAWAVREEVDGARISRLYELR